MAPAADGSLQVFLKPGACFQSHGGKENIHKTREEEVRRLAGEEKWGWEGWKWIECRIVANVSNTDN